MRALVAGLALLMSSISSAQAVHPAPKGTKPQCGIIFKVDWILYAETKQETIDSVTVCDDGKTTAFHSFTAPAFGAPQPEPTKWDYGAEIDKNALSDLRKMLRRSDIAQLPERVDATKTHSPLDVLMLITIVDEGTERIIMLHGPSIGCGEERPEMQKAVWDLICLFADLYNRAKTGTPPENSCGCKSLRELAVD